MPILAKKTCKKRVNIPKKIVREKKDANNVTFQ